jgi:hypothetical protein
MIELKLQIVFVFICVFSVLAPIFLGVRNRLFLNQSLKIFCFWLVFNFLYAVATAFLYKTFLFNYFEYVNTIVSFIFFYCYLKPNWKNQLINRIILGIAIFIILFTFLDFFININHLKGRVNYSANIQTLTWILIGFYYLQRLFKTPKIDNFMDYPMFWIGISNFVCPVISLGYFLITNSAIRFSPTLHMIIENIGYFSALLMNVLFFIGLWKTKNGIREIVQV